MARKVRQARPGGLPKPYELAPHERAAVEAYLARKKQAPLAPRLTVSKHDGVTKIAPDHMEPAIAHVLLMRALGTRDPDFLNGLLEVST
jgi:hypothetical protein